MLKISPKMPPGIFLGISPEIPPSVFPQNYIELSLAPSRDCFRQSIKDSARNCSQDRPEFSYDFLESVFAGLIPGFCTTFSLQILLEYLQQCFMNFIWGSSKASLWNFPKHTFQDHSSDPLCNFYRYFSRNSVEWVSSRPTQKNSGIFPDISLDFSGDFFSAFSENSLPLPACLLRVLLQLLSDGLYVLEFFQGSSQDSSKDYPRDTFKYFSWIFSTYSSSAISKVFARISHVFVQELFPEFPWNSSRDSSEAADNCDYLGDSFGHMD